MGQQPAKPVGVGARRCALSVGARMERAARPRFSPRVQLLLGALVLTVTPGCSPLVSLAGAAIGGLNSGSSAPPAGAFSGAPSAAQNHVPLNSSIGNALALAEQQLVKASCKAKLPADEEPLPAVGCVTRPTCLPGLSTPMPLRLCAKPPPREMPARAGAPAVQAGGWTWTPATPNEPARETVLGTADDRVNDAAPTDSSGS